MEVRLLLDPTHCFYLLLTLPRRHLLTDLRPWICCQVACPCDRRTFNSRDSWLAHLEAQHNVHPDWDDKSCPFCPESIPQGRHTMIRHVELHLQEISLMALPPPADEDEVGPSDTSDWASDAGLPGNIPDDALGKGPEAPGTEDACIPERYAYLLGAIHVHPVCKSATTMEDGLWHCPWEGEVECCHEPTILRHEFE